MIWWLPIAAALPVFFLWNTVHEMSHAVAVLVLGGKVTAFRPYPHLEDGKFVFGYFRYEGKSGVGLHIAPYLTDFIVFTTTAIGIVWIDNPWAFTSVLTILMAPVLDTIAGVQARYRGNERADLAKVHWGWAVPFLYFSWGYASFLAWLIGGRCG